jgi:hypothetical protein
MMATSQPFNIHDIAGACFKHGKFVTRGLSNGRLIGLTSLRFDQTSGP